MELLVFAHRGEAQEFIKRFSFVPMDGNNDLYQAEGRLLLICGEGIYEVFTNLGPLLGQYPIQKVINLGIAGSLDDKARIGDFVSVRTVYCESGQLHFHSFTLADKSAQLDTITSAQRVLDMEYAQKLSNFAPIVDRELWAMAKLCSRMGIPLYAYKLISDKAGEATNCFDLKSRALEFSTSLLEGFLAICSNEETDLTPAEDYPLPMSFTQKARYRKSLSSLKVSEDFDGEKFNGFVERLKSEEGLARKQAANILLEEMELMLNPRRHAVKQSFEKLSSPLSEIGANVLFDKSFEKKKFTLQMEINGQANLEKLKDALSHIHFEAFENVWEGRDV